MAVKIEEVKDLVINEKEVIKQIVEGMDIPSYLNSTNKLLNRLARHFMGEGCNKEEVITNICKVLEDKSIPYEKSHIVKVVEELKYFPLMNYEETVKIYKYEVDKIKTIKTKASQRIAFVMLVQCKIKEIKSHHKNVDSYNKLYGTDAIRDAMKMVGTIQTGQAIEDKFILETCKGLIDYPLFENSVTINYMRQSGKVVYEIKDNFYDLDLHFDRCFGEKLLVIKPDGHEVVDKLEFSKVNKINMSNINKVLNLNRLTLSNMMFVMVNENVTEEEIQNIISIKLDIAKNYRKMKKENGLLYIQMYEIWMTSLLNDLVMPDGTHMKWNVTW